MGERLYLDSNDDGLSDEYVIRDKHFTLVEIC